MTTTTIEKPASKVHPLKKLLVLILVFAVIIVSIVVIRSFPDKKSEFVDTVAGEIEQEKMARCLADGYIDINDETMATIVAVEEKYGL